MDAPNVSAIADVTGLPCSCDSTVAMSCARLWMAAAHSFSLARRNASSFFQVLKASTAPFTASSTCDLLARGQVAKGSPRAGLMTSSCSGVVTERPLISIEYALMGFSPRCGWNVGGRGTGLAQPGPAGNLLCVGAPDQCAVLHRPAGQRPGEAPADVGGDVDAQAPFRGGLLAATPLRETETAHRPAMTVRRLPVEPPAFHVGHRVLEARQEGGPLAVDARVAGPRA